MARLSRGSVEWTRNYYGPGWPNCTGQAAYLSTVWAFGKRFAWNKRAKRGLRRISRVFQQNCLSYYKYLKTQADNGTYNCRPIVGSTTVASNHSFATALDLDWQQNAQGTVGGSMRKRGMEAVNQLKREGVIRWGGDFSNPDDMHFEIIMTPEELKRKYTWNGKLKRKMRGGSRER